MIAQGFSTKLPLLLTFCLLTSLLPASGSVLCPAIAVKSDRVSRGYPRDGSSGIDGRTGRNGRDGGNQTIFVDSSSLKLNLWGENAEDGEDGGDGHRPYCDRDNRNTRNNKW